LSEFVAWQDNSQAPYLRKIIKLMEDKAELVQQLGKENMILQ